MAPFMPANRLRPWLGLPRMRLHDLRPGTETLPPAQHLPARVDPEILGHSPVSMTPNTCSHTIPDPLGGPAQEIMTVFALG